MNAPLWGDSGGHTGTAPTNPHHIFPRIPHKQNNHLCTIFPNEINHPRTIHPNDINRPTRNPPKRHQLPTRNPSKRNRRGGACVPARTSAQRRFHTKNRFCASRIVCGELNDGCVLVGRHGRAHSGVSIPKIHALCMGNLTTDAPLQGDTGGHIGTAPTNLRYTSAYNPPQRHQPPKRNA